MLLGEPSEHNAGLACLKESGKEESLVEVSSPALPSEEGSSRGPRVPQRDPGSCRNGAASVSPLCSAIGWNGPRQACGNDR